MLVQDLDTPCAVVDLDVMENNLRRCQVYLDRHGLRLRPHIKTHKISPIRPYSDSGSGRKASIARSLARPKVMADAGITDILLTYNLINQTKLDRLVSLAHRADIKVVAGIRARRSRDSPPRCPAPGSLCRFWLSATRVRCVAG